MWHMKYKLCFLEQTKNPNYKAVNYLICKPYVESLLKFCFYKQPNNLQEKFYRNIIEQ